MTSNGMTLRKVLRTVGLALIAIGVVALAYLVVSPTGRYLIRAGWEEGKILYRRRPIAQIVNDSTTPKAVAQKLRLVLAARAFAGDSIHLAAKQSFATYT